MLNNKKVFLFFAGVLFLSLFVVNFASAYRFGFVGSLDSAIYQAQPVLQFFFGGYDYTGYMLFERILLFLLILSIVFVSLKTAPFFKGVEQRKIVVLVSVIVSLLSVRYIDYAWFNTVIMTYQVFGIAITSVLPFIIYFFFLMGVAPPESNYSGIRKIGWVLFGCVYLGLYVTTDTSFYGRVYLWTAFGALLFFLIDGTIQDYFRKQKLKHQTTRSLTDRMAQLQKEINDLMALGAADVRSPYNYRLKEKSDEMKEISKLILKG